MTNQKSPGRSGPPMPITVDNPFGLTDSERVFVGCYIKDFDGPAASRAGGWKNKRQAWMLLARPEIRGAIQAAIHQRQKMVQRLLGNISLESERVLLEIARIAFSDIRKLYDENDALLPPDAWDDHTAAAVASIKSKELFEEQEVPDANGNMVKRQVLVGYLREVKTWDKNSALDKAMRHLGGYELDNQQKNALSDAATSKLQVVRAMLADVMAKHEKKVDNQESPAAKS